MIETKPVEGGLNSVEQARFLQQLSQQTGIDLDTISQCPPAVLQEFARAMDAIPSPRQRTNV